MDGILGALEVEGAEGGAGAGENSVEGVVILVADGVEFVIMAAGAGDGETEEGFCYDIDLVIGEADEFVEGIGGSEPVVDHAKVAETEDGFVEIRGGIYPGGVEEVAGEVFADELIVGDVSVEGTNDVIPVAPSVGDGRVTFAAVAFGVAEPI